MKNFQKVSIASLIVLTIGIFGISSIKKHQDSAGKQVETSFFIPEIAASLQFAGEQLPTKDVDVMERLDKELLVNTFWHSNTILLLKRANRYFPIIEPILKKNGIPDDFKYLCMIESGLSNVVSPSNAAGFWQFLEATGKKYGLEINEEVDERYHLEKATQAACDYLNNSYQLFNNWTLAAAAYNMGESGVLRQLAAQGVGNYYDLHLNTETSRYIFRILAAKEIYSNQVKYGFDIQKENLYPSIASKLIAIDSAINDLPQFALQLGTNYKHLKLLNPWLRKSFLKNKNKKLYRIALPENAILTESQIIKTEGEAEN